MPLKFERGAGPARDVVLIEPDGTVFTSFAKTGYLHAAARTRFARGTAAATGAFAISSGQAAAHDAEQEALVHAEGRANHGLVFVSEVDGAEKIALIERFASEDDARRALSTIESALRRYVVTQRRARLWRSMILWAGAPLLTFIVAMSAVHFLDSHNAAFEELNRLAHLAQDNPSVLGLPTVSLPTAAAAASSVPAPVAMAAEPTAANAPADAPVSASAAAGPARARAMASIHFGLDRQPARKTLYVYSDPNCPACRQFESHIDDLARDFSVYVLPVAYQEGSAKVASQVLCASDRKQKWVDTMHRPKTTDAVSGDDCQRGYVALRANMDTFESLGFDSTPRVVDGDGAVFAAGATANAIRIQAAAR